jgi:fucose permease
MKTKSFRAITILIGLLLITVSAQAGIGESFQEFAGSSFSNFQGLYIIAGIVIASLVLYIVLNHFNKEEDEKSHHHASGHAHHRRHRHVHHVHKVIKKTQ